MSIVAKALWFIESHFASDIMLEDIARTCEISRYHLSRVFGDVVGVPIMNYVRGRRLSAAARALTNPDADILSIALSSGYSSHEAFSRAFRDHFGIVPSELRNAGALDRIMLTPAARLDAQTASRLDLPRIVRSRPFRVAGLEERYSFACSHEVPAQWQRFTPLLGKVPGQVGPVAYGLRYANEADGFSYLCGVEVFGASVEPPLRELSLPECSYIVFTHRDHIATIRATHLAIWNEWLPRLDVATLDAPDFERYDTNFNPHTGVGPVEIWIPVQDLGRR